MLGQHAWVAIFDEALIWWLLVLLLENWLQIKCNFKKIVHIWTWKLSGLET